MEYVIQKHTEEAITDVYWNIWQILHDFGLLPLPCHSLLKCVYMSYAVPPICLTAAATNWRLVQHDAAGMHPPQTAGLVRLPVARDTKKSGQMEGLVQEEEENVRML